MCIYLEKVSLDKKILSPLPNAVLFVVYYVTSIESDIFHTGESFIQMEVSCGWKFHTSGSFTRMEVSHGWKFHMGRSFTRMEVSHGWKSHMGGSFTRMS